MFRYSLPSPAGDRIRPFTVFCIEVAVYGLCFLVFSVKEVDVKIKRDISCQFSPYYEIIVSRAVQFVLRKNYLLNILWNVLRRLLTAMHGVMMVVDDGKNWWGCQ